MLTVKNFTETELKEYYNNNETVFFNYKRVFILDYSVNCGFFFYELTSKRVYNKLPYTLRGKFHAMNPDWDSCKKLLN